MRREISVDPTPTPHLLGHPIELGDEIHRAVPVSSIFSSGSLKFGCFRGVFISNKPPYLFIDASDQETIVNLEFFTGAPVHKASDCEEAIRELEEST